MRSAAGTWGWNSLWVIEQPAWGLQERMIHEGGLEIEGEGEDGGKRGAGGGVVMA